MRKKIPQHAQPNGPESPPHLQNQKHLLIASKRQRGSVSLSAAVIPHSDEHLKCQDPFQQPCTSNQALSSVTAISQPLHLSPYDLFPRCVWRQGKCEHINKHCLLEGQPGGREEETRSCPATVGRGRKGHHTGTFGGLGLDRGRALSMEGLLCSRGREPSALRARRVYP